MMENLIINYIELMPIINCQSQILFCRVVTKKTLPKKVKIISLRFFIISFLLLYIR